MHQPESWSTGGARKSGTKKTAEQPKNVIKHVKNVENFGNFISTLGILKSIPVHSKTLRDTLCAS